MNGIIYTRVSSDEQVKGTSLEFQEELCRKYCEQRNIIVNEVFREEGESAKDLSLNNRKKFLEALEYCRKNKNQIEAFIVLRVDRFARNTEDHFAVRKILLDYGTTLISVTEPIGNKPAEKFIETVLAGAAEYDNAIRKQRCTDGMIARINQGIFPFKPPFGYICSHCRRRGEKKTEPDLPDENTFPIIQRALKEYSRGIYRQVDILQMLIRSGLTRQNGKKPTSQFVDRLFRKYLRFYAGIIVNPWTGEEKIGLHKAMITKEEMYQIEQVLYSKGRKKVTKCIRYNPQFPLRRTLLCNACKSFFTGSVSHGNGGYYSYYHCANKVCSMYGKGVSKNIVERDFIHYLDKIIPNEKTISVFKETIVDLWNDWGKQYEIEIKRNKNVISILETKKKRIYEMREDGSYDKEEFIVRKKEIEAEIIASKITLNELQVDDLDIEKSLNKAMDFICTIGQKWRDLPILLQSRFQKLVFPEGILYEKIKGFGTAKLGYIFRLFQQFEGMNSSNVHPSEISWNQLLKELEEWQKLNNAEVENKNQFNFDIEELIKNTA